MNKYSLKTIGIIAIVCLIRAGILSVFFKILPYLVIAGAVTWGVSTIIKAFKKGSRGNTDDVVYNDTVQNNDQDIVEVIDVDYKDADKN